MRYTVYFDPAASRDLESISPRDRSRIIQKIASLVSDPRRPGVKKLRGFKDLYRLRVGDYRVVYRIDDGRLVVIIVEVGHRRNMY